MTHLPPPDILVIGVGNPDRGDDAIGRVVARRVDKAAPVGLTVIEQGGDGARMMEAWHGAGAVIVIDAANCEGDPGTIHRFDAAAAPLPTRAFRHSTHAFGLAEAIELSRALHQLPCHFIVFGIVGRDFQLGHDLTPQVREAAERATRSVLAEAFPDAERGA